MHLFQVTKTKQYVTNFSLSKATHCYNKVIHKIAKNFAETKVAQPTSYVCGFSMCACHSMPQQLKIIYNENRRIMFFLVLVSQ